MSSQSINSLTSFSGSDLVCTIGDQAVSELQQITWAIQREKAPIYTLGSPDPRSFSRCKRAIAGSMVFFAFDHDALLEALKRNWDKIAPPAMFTAAGNITVSNSENFLDALDTVKWNKKVTEDVANSFKNNGYGWSGSTEISPNDPVEGSNSVPVVDSSNFVTGWTKSESEIIVPPGFEPIRGENVNYIDTIPPLTCIA